MRGWMLSALTLVVLTGPAASAQTTPETRQRARMEAQAGWEQLRSERWEAAAAAFQKAIDIDNQYEDAFYGLGRANLAMKRFVSAIGALNSCKDLYVARAGKQFTNQQEAQRYRNDRITEIDEQIRQVQTMPPSMQQQDMLRQLNNQRRDIQEAITRGNNLTIDSSVPPWVSLSLGSAYFRSGKLADAEREFKATIAADSKSGEAHNNLAVVYFETGRYAEAADEVKAAKKAGVNVHPQLEQDIKDHLKRPSIRHH